LDSRVKIIGVGSPFADDRLGWVAAETLLSLCLADRTEQQVSILSLDRPGPSIISQWQDADAVIIIDAVRSGAEPGTVQCLDADTIDVSEATSSSHGFGIASAIEVARALNELPQQIYLCGIEINEMHVGDSLSPIVQKALPELIERIEDLVGMFVSQHETAG
jgi:hydrogenase maturation protease